MRITSGTFRGRNLASPNSELTHPMGDREKLALFNSLGDSVKDVAALDLFAGSGALGLEALSRGAKHVDFVENSHPAVRTIKENIAALDISSRAKVFSQKAEVFLAYALTEEKKYDLILIDPPYDKFDELFKSGSVLSELGKLLSLEGKLVLSHPGLVPPTEMFKGLTLRSSRKYARANISFFEK